MLWNMACLGQSRPSSYLRDTSFWFSELGFHFKLVRSWIQSLFLSTAILRFTNYLSAEPQGSPVKMDIVEQAKPEPSPRKTKSTGEAKESPSKQRMARQKQSVKLKLEALMQKEPELTRRRPVRQASRKSFYSDALNLVLVGAVFTNWSSVPFFLANKWISAWKTIV